mgnify:CR=1 FL=1
MSYKEKAENIYEQLQQGKLLEAFDQYYGKDVVMNLDADVSRLPNVVQKGHTIDPITGTAKQGKDVDAFMSPTSFL